MKTHLFLFTLGPVQSFIAQARKVHDLYSGSQILSQLCKVAANHFKNTHGGEVIFPDIKSDSIPNRFLGKITTTNDLSAIGKSVFDAVQDEWQKRFDELIAKPLNLSGTVYKEAKCQIEQHLDIQWLFQPLANNDDKTYVEAYNDLNKNLNALKNTRPFHISNETGRKCSLDGERNVIFYRKTEQQTKEDKDVQKGNPLFSSANIVFNSTVEKAGTIQLRHLQPGEGLSAVSMLKRFQDFEAGDFPDTAEFALAKTMHEVGQTYLTEMSALFGHDHPKHLNWQLFFEENLNKRYFEKQGLPISKLEKATEIQRKLTEKARSNGRKLEKYYAIVVFDGDHMGEWWSGKRLKGGENLEDFHRDLTAQLAKFAEKVNAEYPKENQHRGWVIYAGGDDFLGFFNLHHLTNGLDYLRKTYLEIVYKPLSHRIQDGDMLTFSAGVCIAHYKEPLSLVLSQARQLEKDAKSLRDEKDAIGIGVIPGSGQIAEVVLPFEKFPYLGKVISDLQTPDFSNAFVNKARTELIAFVDKNGKLDTDLLGTAQSLLDRAVNRASNLKKGKDESDDDFKKRKKEKVEPLQIAVKELMKANGNKIKGFFDALDIADFIERQTHISSIQNPLAEA